VLAICAYSAQGYRDFNTYLSCYLSHWQDWLFWVHLQFCTVIRLYCAAASVPTNRAHSPRSDYHYVTDETMSIGRNQAWASKRGVLVFSRRLFDDLTSRSARTAQRSQGGVCLGTSERTRFRILPGAFRQNIHQASIRLPKYAKGDVSLLHLRLIVRSSCQQCT
jgi:hypothetical protein